MAADNKLARDFTALEALHSRLSACDPRELKCLTRDARVLGGGMYNDVFLVRVPLGGGAVRGVAELVMRLSYYNTLTQRRIALADAAGDAAARAAAEATDPVSVQHALGQLATRLARNRVSPHFVCMLDHRLCPNFAALVAAKLRAAHARKDRRAGGGPCAAAASRARPADLEAFEHCGVSFHERFDGHLAEMLAAGRLTQPQALLCTFQVMHALATLQRFLPTFRHNDMSAANVLVALHAPPRAPRWAEYRFGVDHPTNTRVVLAPDLGVCCGVHDFDLAHADDDAGGARCSSSGRPLALRNALVAEGVFQRRAYAAGDPDACARHVCADANRSFDVYFFLHSLRRACARQRERYADLLALVESLAPELADDAAPRYCARVRPHLFPARLAAEVLGPRLERAFPAGGAAPFARHAWPATAEDAFRERAEEPLDTWRRCAIMTRAELRRLAAAERSAAVAAGSSSFDDDDGPPSSDAALPASWPRGRLLLAARLALLSAHPGDASLGRLATARWLREAAAAVLGERAAARLCAQHGRGPKADLAAALLGRVA